MTKARSWRELYCRCRGVWCWTRDCGERPRRNGAAEPQSSSCATRRKWKLSDKLTGGLADDFKNLLSGTPGSLEFLKTRKAQGRLDEIDR